jgi:hypothetical protein
MSLGLILMSREECVDKHCMTPEETQWIFGKVIPYQEKPDGAPEYLLSDVAMAEKAWAIRQKPDHEFFGDPANGGVSVGTAYVARRLDISQSYVRVLIKKNASLRKTMLGRSTKARIRFRLDKVDSWIDNYLRQNPKSDRRPARR